MSGTRFDQAAPEQLVSNSADYVWIKYVHEIWVTIQFKNVLVVGGRLCLMNPPPTAITRQRDESRGIRDQCEAATPLPHNSGGDVMDQGAISTVACVCAISSDTMFLRSASTATGDP